MKIIQNQLEKELEDHNKIKKMNLQIQNEEGEE